MNKHESILLLACAALFFLAGCAKQQRYEATEQICIPDLEKQQAMQIAQDILGKMHFTIDKADTEQGLIRTNPLPGAQFFEFWRSDNVGTHNRYQANLQSIRRTAELNISQEGEKLCIGCDVKVQRLALPEHQVSSTAQAYQMFSQSIPSMQMLKLYPEQEKGIAWVDLGEDAELATEILKRIEKQITQQ